MGLRWEHPAKATLPAPGPAARLRHVATCAAVIGLWMLGAALLLPRPPVTPAPHLTPEARTLMRAEPSPSDALTTPPPLGAPERSQVDPASAPVVTPVVDPLARSSLRGSEVDGELRRDAEGRLQWDAGLVRFFEFHLALLGELDLRAIRGLIAEHASRRLDATGVDSVLAAFERYVAFRQSLASLPPTASLADTLAARRALEVEWFGVDAEAMFGASRAYDARTLDRLQAGARAADSAAGWEALPASEREARSGMLAEEQNQQFAALGVSAQQRQAERIALWGAQAAARLDALDAERAAWDARLAAYARERERLLSRGAAAPAELDALRQRRFDARERLRVEGMERAGAL
ncbi:MAG: lipase secretion chaperone [Lysobacterales bacterium]|jgi:lipase chaperone LimK